MNRVDVRVQRVEEGRDLPLPRYQTDGSAGLDLRARVDGELQLSPGERALVPTGLRMAIPVGWEGQVRPRSGLAIRHGVTLVNAPGTVDSDYRGEICVLLINLGDEPFTVKRGDRIAQIVVQAVARAELTEVDELPTTERGSGGFGHSGRS